MSKALTVTFLFCSLISFAQNVDFEELSSIHNESHANLYPDGKTLYFTIANHEGNSVGKRDKGDIWFSKLSIEGKWLSPVNLKAPTNSKYNDRILGFSKDGERMYLHGHYERNDEIVRTQGIAVSEYRRGNWTFPENIEIPYFKNNSNHQSGYIHKDENILLIAAESFDTEGNEDIYVSFKENGSWSELMNLGPDINTKFQEFTPFLSDNKQVLFFSTNGRGGEGSSDIFYSIRKDNTWKNWSEPVNLGSEINTVGKDVGFIILNDLRKILYITNTSSNGYGNIKITPPVGEIDTLFAPIPEEPFELLPKESDNGFVIELLNQNGEPLNTGKIFAVQEDGTLTDLEFLNDGLFVYKEDPSNIIFQAHAPAYIPREVTADNESRLTIILQQVKVGATVKLDNVLFEQASTTILPGSERDLNLVVDMLEENPNLKIELAGHTDNRGSAKKNVKLSKKRVRAVKKYLTDAGISGMRIKGKGYGGEKPIASNDSEETRKLNRRVEFTILEN